ncbi:hypothetical protein tb265_06910 [Gemmatimonadetes bacterium T265]|nr:hypothetical protein tb265_06910 [Gemmatimonadetes bacterium T265]
MRLTPEDRERLRVASDTEYLDSSAFARRAILQAIDRALAAAPAGDPAAPQPPAQGAPAQGAPAQGAPAQGAPAQGAPAQGAPAQGAPAQGAPAQGAPAQGAPAQGRRPRGRRPRGRRPRGRRPRGRRPRGRRPRGRRPRGRVAAAAQAAPPAGADDRPLPPGRALTAGEGRGNRAPRDRSTVRPQRTTRFPSRSRIAQCPCCSRACPPIAQTLAGAARASVDGAVQP